jgi:hypothetical protein
MKAPAPFEGRKMEFAIPYSIALRSRTDATITGWYDGTDNRWSTDHKRQKLFTKKGDARTVCHELLSLSPRNAKVISIETAPDDPSLDRAPRGSSARQTRKVPRDQFA